MSTLDASPPPNPDMHARTIPCPLCGYHAPAMPCPHCRLDSAEPSLRTRSKGGIHGVLDGLRALPMGLSILARTPRTVRWLVPPVAITALVYAILFVLCWRGIDRFFEAVRDDDVAALGLEPGWWSDRVHQLAHAPWMVALVQAGTLVAFVVVAVILGLWTFSVVYELVSGPFLDTVQARVEQRWFGRDPRATLEAERRVEYARAALVSAVVAVLALAAIVAWWTSSTSFGRWWLVAAPVPFAIACASSRGYRAWVRWFLQSQARALFVSLQAALVAAAILVLFFWVKFVPFLGLPMFAMLAGFATSITLLDIPFSRRGFSLGQRLRFVLVNFGAVMALGVTTSLVFVVPAIGPLVGLPAASIGGLWLVCRLDKNALRPPGARL